MLQNSAENNLSIWKGFNAGMAGNIYAADTDTTLGINWGFLQAITRDTSGLSNANTLNDFEDIDVNVGLTTFVDSVNKTFSSGGTPKSTNTFSVFGSSIFNVPIVDSTNNSNFITGILWDTDDSSNAFYDATDDEDLVFVTKINTNATGKYGNYDYEIRVPGDLTSYKGATNTITFYYELT